MEQHEELIAGHACHKAAFPVGAGKARGHTADIGVAHIAVSYTHLDVYKRQGWWRSKKDNVFTALAALTCSAVTYGFTRSIFLLDFCIYTKSAVQNWNCT